MVKAWKIVVTVAVVLLAVGVVMGGVGLITGASLSRMAEVVFGGVEQMRDTFMSLLDKIEEMFASLI